jgi:hypothetical protein
VTTEQPTPQPSGEGAGGEETTEAPPAPAEQPTPTEPAPEEGGRPQGSPELADVNPEGPHGSPQPS